MMFASSKFKINGTILAEDQDQENAPPKKALFTKKQNGSHNTTLITISRRGREANLRKT